MKRMKCYSCKSVNGELRVVELNVWVGDRAVGDEWVELEVCRDCGAYAVSADTLEKVELRAVVTAFSEVKSVNGRMLRFARHGLGHSRDQFARLTASSLADVILWEETDPPPDVVTLVIWHTRQALAQDEPGVAGKVLQEQLTTLCMSVEEFSAEAHIPEDQVKSVLDGSRAIDPGLAKSLAGFFVGSTELFWMRLNVNAIRYARESIGRSLRSARENAGLTTAEAAEALGVDPQNHQRKRISLLDPTERERFTRGDHTTKGSGSPYSIRPNRVFYPTAMPTFAWGQRLPTKGSGSPYSIRHDVPRASGRVRGPATERGDASVTEEYVEQVYELAGVSPVNITEGADPLIDPE